MESRHRGAFVVVDASGKIVHSAGDSQMPVYPRSAVKPLQAIPLIETGAADRFGLTDKELALACASHKGEPAHVEAVTRWLMRIGLGHAALECGIQAPRTPDAAKRAILAGIPLNAAYHNCSGKHTGFLTACVACGDNPSGYIEPDHPAQKRVTQALAEMTGCDLSAAPVGRDGCGIPTYRMPLHGLATGMARLADPSKLPKARAEAAKRLLNAMAAEPFYVNGTGGFTTEVDGGCSLGSREGRRRGRLCRRFAGAGSRHGAENRRWGHARAAECAAAHILRGLDASARLKSSGCEAFLNPVIKTDAGRDTGTIRPTAALALPVLP